jgi:riboflavin kinase/FMN adenylyltransferase
MTERIQLLEEAGLQHLIVFPFTLEFSRKSALEYVRDLLVNAIGVKYLVVGYDHHFGRNREGDIQLLREYAETFAFQVEEIAAQTLEEVNISSTKVRNAIKDGDVAAAERYLGYAYRLAGLVVEGEGRGRQLGFPTANVIPLSQEKLVPSVGVYAVEVVMGGRSYPAMLNIGHKPTFHGEVEWPLGLEVHIIDWTGDIYGKELEVRFKERLRPETAFDSPDELKDQLAKDRLTTLRLFA